MARLGLVDGAFSEREVDVVFKTTLPLLLPCSWVALWEREGPPVERAALLDRSCRARVGMKHEIQFKEAWLST